MELISLSKKQVISRLQFYSKPPTGEASLEDIEDLAIERLKVLRIFESVALDYVKGSTEYNAQLNKQLSNCSDLGKHFTHVSVNDSKDLLANMERDVLSHYTVRVIILHTAAIFV